MADEKRICALTFDDGPSDVTPDVLDILEKYGAKASFFVIGNNVNEKSSALVQRAYDMGCEINNHSLTHSFMNEMSGDVIKDEIAKTNEIVKEVTGEYPKFFRPPFIAVSDTMYESIELPFICGLGAEDWVPETTAQSRAEKIIESAKDGCIFLLHDMTGNTRTVEALETIIPALKEQGYDFVTVSELFAMKNVVPERNKIYSFAE